VQEKTNLKNRGELDEVEEETSKRAAGVNAEVGGPEYTSGKGEMQAEEEEAQGEGQDPLPGGGCLGRSVLRRRVCGVVLWCGRGDGGHGAGGGGAGREGRARGRGQ
jgi:hypothetical protein